MTDGSRTHRGERKLRRVTHGKECLGGVCAGLAYHLGAPAWIVRFVWLFVILFGGFGLLVYLVLWIIMPKWDEIPEDYDEVTGD